MYSGVVVLWGEKAPAFVEMVASDAGSVIMVWVRDTRTFASPRHLRAQKVGPAGNRAWNAGVDVVVQDAIAVPIAHRPRIASDGAGGAVMAWHDTRLSNRFNVWVQRYDAGGAAAFEANGKRVTLDDEFIHLDPAIAYDAAGDRTVVFWNRRNSAQSQWGTSGQAISDEGDRLWGNNGVEVTPVDGEADQFPRVVLGSGPAAGDAFVVFSQPVGAIDVQRRLLAARVGPAGGLVWPGNGLVELSSVPSQKGRLPVVRNVHGAVTAVWEDNRAGNNDVYAQNVHPGGVLGFCAADQNRDAFVGTADITAFLSAWFADRAAGTAGAGDFDGDGSVGTADITAYLSAWFATRAGGC